MKAIFITGMIMIGLAIAVYGSGWSPAAVEAAKTPQVERETIVVTEGAKEVKDDGWIYLLGGAVVVVIALMSMKSHGGGGPTQINNFAPSIEITNS